MNEQGQILAPLTRDMLTAAAVEHTGNGANTHTVRTCVDFALWALKEADRLALPWKKRMQCEMKGHVFRMPAEANTNIIREDGVQSLIEYTAKKVDCVNCDAVLEISYKEKM